MREKNITSSVYNEEKIKIEIERSLDSSFSFDDEKFFSNGRILIKNATSKENESLIEKKRKKKIIFSRGPIVSSVTQ